MFGQHFNSSGEPSFVSFRGAVEEQGEKKYVDRNSTHAEDSSTCQYCGIHWVVSFIRYKSAKGSYKDILLTTHFHEYVANLFSEGLDNASYFHMKIFEQKISPRTKKERRKFPLFYRLCVYSGRVDAVWEHFGVFACTDNFIGQPRYAGRGNGCYCY